MIHNWSPDPRVATPVFGDDRIEKELVLPPGGAFALRTDSGQVTVRGTSRPNVRLVITSRRDDLEDRFRLSFAEHPGEVTVTAKNQGSWPWRWFFWWGDSIHFDVEVPYETTLDLHTSGGRIDVTKIDGDVEAHTSGGMIAVEEISGVVEVHTSGGGINFEEIDGELSARTSGGSIKDSDRY